MQLTKGTFLLLTLCLSCAGSWASAVSEALITNLEDLAKTLTGNLTELDAVVTAETDPIKNKALNSGQTVLKGLYTNLENLQSELADINDKINDTIGEQIETAITDLQTWGEEQLQRVNESTDGAGVPQANGLIANVINRYTSALPRTLNELNFLNRTFESNVNIAIDDYTKFARALIDQMNNCAEQSRNRCKDNIAILSAKVRTSTGRLNRIVRSGNQLVASGDRATKNFENLETKLVKDQEKCEKNLDRIIKINPTTTTAATTSETTDESEATTSATTAESEATTIETTAESEATTIETTAESEATTIETTAESEATTIETTAESEATTIETTAESEATTIETTAESEATTIETTAESEATTSETTDESEATTIETTAESDATTSETTDESEATTIETTADPDSTTDGTTADPDPTDDGGA